MRKLMVILAMALVLCGAFAMSAQAITQLDFTIGAVQNPITTSIQNTGFALVGTDISITEVTGIDTPLIPNVSTPITGGVLNFTVLNPVVVDPTHWDFAGPGTISIFGDIGGGNVPLLTGTTTSARAFAPDENDFSAARVTFTDVKDLGLSALYGLPNVPFTGSLNVGFFTTAVPQDTFFSNDVGSGDVHNLPIPIPPSAFLLGSGLLGLVGFRFRRTRA